jgi:hypothetical protein
MKHCGAAQRKREHLQHNEPEHHDPPALPEIVRRRAPDCPLDRNRPDEVEESTKWWSRAFVLRRTLATARKQKNALMAVTTSH